MTTHDREFLDILERNRGRILRFASVCSEDPTDREDLVQEIVYELWRAMPNFRGESEVSTFVYRVALQTAMRVARQRHRGLDGRRLLAGLRITGDDQDPALDALRRERIEQLRAAVRRLPEIDRLLVTLHLEGVGTSGIAAIAGISANLVSVRLRRARARLQRLLEQSP